MPGGSPRAESMELIEKWLDRLGLRQYGSAFVQADIDPSVLPDLTEADLERLGVSLGHRKKLLRAIAALKESGVDGAGFPPVGIPATSRASGTMLSADVRSAAAVRRTTR